MSRSTTTGRRAAGWHWSEYWQSGRIEIMTVDTATGSTVFDPGPVWREFFGAFESGSRLIDLATGGGQVARLAGETAASVGWPFEIIGVDYADLGPSGGEVGGGVRLVGGVALESLPFPAAHFDGASSQFGIEYADTRLALGELARVLKPGGRARMLIHHSGSVVSRSTAEQMAAHDKVLPDDAAILKARKAFTAYLKRMPPPAVRAAEEAFREAVRRAAGRLERSEAFAPAGQHVEYLHDLAARIARYEPASALARLDVFEAGVGAWRQRHRSQMKAALDRAGLDTFLHRAGQKGLETVEAVEENDGRGALVAWRVDLRRT